MAWKQKARELKRASDVIFISVEGDFAKSSEISTTTDSDINVSNHFEQPLLPTYILLAGLSLENLFKAMIVIDHPDHVNEKEIKKTLLKHDLIFLSEKASVNLNEEENRFCKIASAAITGFGRYPITSKKTTMTGQWTIHADSKQVFDKMYTRLTDELPTRCKNRKR